MNVQDMIKAKLAELKADGLTNPDWECGCGIDDLFPCGQCELRCEPAVKTIAKKAGDSYEAGDEIYVKLDNSSKTLTGRIV